MKNDEEKHSNKGEKNQSNMKVLYLEWGITRQKRRLLGICYSVRCSLYNTDMAERENMEYDQGKNIERALGNTSKFRKNKEEEKSKR